MKISDPTKIVWHLLRIRTAVGDEWEPACQHIISPLLALRTAKVLRDYLCGVPTAQESAPQWAIDIANAIRDDGADPARCAVVIYRGRPARWRKVTVLTAVAKEKPARRGRKRVC